MNQFKRAKQTGHQTESITDLKTAGIAPQKEETPITSLSQPEKKAEAHSDKTDAAPTPQVQAADSEHTVILQKMDIPTTQEPTTNTITPITRTEEDINPSPDPKTEPPIQPTIYNEGSLQHPKTTVTSQPTLQMQTNIPVLQQKQAEPVASYIEPIEQFIEPKTVKSSKKSAPNMFSQKTESKSIRKSLVLKPSSVKKAENYCAKNGGSFNELIQILLDNFIEQYDL